MRVQSYYTGQIAMSDTTVSFGSKTCCSPKRFYLKYADKVLLFYLVKA